eukprot:gene3108-3648_t
MAEGSPSTPARPALWTWRWAILSASVFAAAWAAKFWTMPPKFAVPPVGGILVTGAGSGIGKAVVEHLAKRMPHYTIYGLVRQRAHAEAIEAAATGKNVHALTADITEPSEVDAALLAMRESLEAAGLPLVGFFDSAGVTVPNVPVEFMDIEHLKTIYEVDVFGLVAILQRVIPLLRASQGRICLMGSITGVVTPAFMGMDPARTIETVADAVRRELLPYQVAVSVIQAGFIASPILGKTEAMDSQLLAATPGMATAYPRLQANQLSKQDPASMDHPVVVAQAVGHALLSTSPRI